MPDPLQPRPQLLKKVVRYIEIMENFSKRPPSSYPNYLMDEYQQLRSDKELNEWLDAAKNMIKIGAL